MTSQHPETNLVQHAFDGDWQAWTGYYTAAKIIGKGPTPLDAIRALLDKEESNRFNAWFDRARS